MAVGTYALCTLSNVQDFYGFTGATDEDKNLLEDLINSMTTTFESYCDREFKTREHTDYYDGAGSRFLYTNHYPITSVSGIWDDYDWDWIDADLVDSTNYRISNDGRRIILLESSAIFANRTENIKIIYTAGYTTIPEDISQACIEEVVRKYKHRKDIDVISKSTGDGSVTRYQKELLQSTIQVLNKYRRIGIV